MTFHSPPKRKHITGRKNATLLGKLKSIQNSKRLVRAICLRRYNLSSMVVYIFDPSPQDAEVGGSPGQTVLHRETLTQKDLVLLGQINMIESGKP